MVTFRGRKDESKSPEKKKTAKSRPGGARASENTDHSGKRRGLGDALRKKAPGMEKKSSSRRGVGGNYDQLLKET